MVLTTNLLEDARDTIQDRLATIAVYGAVGTDDTTPATSDTALGTEVFRDVIDEVDVSQLDTITISLRILTNEANGNSLVESGLLNAVISGTLWTRNTFTVVNKTSDIQFFVDTTITIEVTEGS